MLQLAEASRRIGSWGSGYLSGSKNAAAAAAQDAEATTTHDAAATTSEDAATCCITTSWRSRWV